MIKALVILLWPMGIVVILMMTALVARRLRSVGSPATVDLTVMPRSARSSIIGLLLILVAGAVIVYTPTTLLGLVAVHAGPAIDKPIYAWTIHNRVQFWVSVMERVTKVGDPWTTWGAVATAAVCLAACYRRNKWLPPVALGAAVVVDHYLALALRHTFERVGPPASPDGMFPSGGCDRVVALYGLIAYLIWRELGGDRQQAIWAAGIVGALGFSEAYSRGYLTLHWFTDIISGLVYGTLILAVFIFSIRLVDGPARKVIAGLPPRPVISDRPAPARQ